MIRRVLVGVSISVAVLSPSITVAAPAGPTTIAAPKVLTVDVTLVALDRLHQFGYTIDTPARADRAIRHWQRANGLTVDGIVGPQTQASLGLVQPATVSVPAVRQTPPAPTVDGTVEDIIRQIWPDDLEDHALAIATRESRLVPTARNSCCWGLFQIHWSAHRSWLAGLGITAPAELLDARTNTRAAYALYQLDGWAPWSL
jgi:hypothetical protein